jgi:hypothetical protein
MGIGPFYIDDDLIHSWKAIGRGLGGDPAA